MGSRLEDYLFAVKYRPVLAAHLVDGVARSLRFALYSTALAQANAAGHSSFQAYLTIDILFGRDSGHCRQHGLRPARTDDHLISGLLVLFEPSPQTVGDKSVIAGRAVIGCDQRFYAVLSEFRQYEPQLL